MIMNLQLFGRGRSSGHGRPLGAGDLEKAETGIAIFRSDSGVSSEQMQNARQATDLKQLTEYMKSVGVRVEPSMSKIEFDLAKEMVAGMEDMIREFPDLREMNLRINTDFRDSKAYAGAKLDGTVAIEPSNMKTAKAARRSWERDVKKGFHPQGTDYRSTTIHEMGHQLEAVLIHREFSGSDRGKAWENNTISTRLVGRAMDRVHPDWRTNSRAAAGAIRGISHYAMVNPSETLAEAVSDVFSNRDRANPLSRAIWNEVKDELRRTRK